MPAATLHTFEPGLRAPESASDNAQWYLFQGQRLLLERGEDGGLRVPTAVSPAVLGLPLDEGQVHYLGRRRDTASVSHCYAGDVPDGVPLRPDMQVFDLRSVFDALDSVSIGLAGRARQIVQWDRDHRYCSRCAQPMVQLDYERAKTCAQCGLTSYPRIAPAIITAITRTQAGDRQILLARSPRFPEDMYSVIAGFVEPGETLEECVRREVYEEVGVDVENIRYFGSQPWPFPNSLMLGFTAEYAGGDIRLEEEEIADARWFGAYDLPRVPLRISIARQLIDWFVAEAGGDPSAVRDWIVQPREG